MSETSWRPWLPEAIAVLMVLVVGVTEAVLLSAVAGSLAFGLTQVPQVLVVAGAVGLCRRAPGAALAGVWGLGLLHVMTGAPIMLTEFALTAVFFGGARWGRPPTVLTSALSVPLAVVVAYVLSGSSTAGLLLGGSPLGGILRQDPALLLVLSLIALLVVAAPWPAGLVMRFLVRARNSRAAMLVAEDVAAGARRETEHAREVADLRDQQTRLARDVHDVVGHSLAVILAQAESGQYLDDDAKLKKTLQTIATSARSSLQDVRQVLSSTRESTVDDGDTGELDELIAGVRDSGHEIIATDRGTGCELSPQSRAVAYRVLQEMLTNAIKHGRRDRPITAERHWPSAHQPGDADVLRIEVTNMTETFGRGQAGTGRGVDGMRRRLASIGGHLDVRRRAEPAGTSFRVTAVVPVRGGAR
ncbi:sensor histidine kinase [Mangrovihabitans endophyticus]|uniref:histidine kinase n=1 Tax=Mangrovihabitans endophyticus TaxID=1751298 RepID=A0A8J3C1R2_9ACTN|nr:histidine kinase [Mangrovihabitans endophyticus]GGL02524.1 hypothetical protein GCM10012284_41370 [Mangrovihabitans endophyticus]